MILEIQSPEPARLMKGYQLSFLIAAAAYSSGFPPSEETAASASVKAPFQNYWDTNSWEASSASTFWRSTSATSQPESYIRSLSSHSSSPLSNGLFQSFPN